MAAYEATEIVTRCSGRPRRSHQQQQQQLGLVCFSFLFLTNKIQKVYAVGCQELANGQPHEARGRGKGHVIRIRIRLEYAVRGHRIFNERLRKRKPNGASVAQFNLFPASNPEPATERKTERQRRTLTAWPAGRSAQSLNTQIYRFIKSQTSLNSVRQRKFLGSPQVNSFSRKYCLRRNFI